MTMTIGRKFMYAVGGLAAGALMTCSLSSCAVGKTKLTEEEVDSVITQYRLMGKGIYDPTISYAQAKMKLDSVLRQEFPEARNLEEAIEKDDSARLARNCEEIGVIAPKKPAANATDGEKMSYDINSLIISLRAACGDRLDSQERVDEVVKVAEQALKEDDKDFQANCEIIEIPVPEKIGEKSSRAEQMTYVAKRFMIYMEAGHKKGEIPSSTLHAYYNGFEQLEANWLRKGAIDEDGIAEIKEFQEKLPSQQKDTDLAQK